MKIKVSDWSIVSLSYNSTEPSSSLIQIKLLKLELPKFRGDITQWQGSWDLFNTSIQKNKPLSNIEKLNHLQTFLIDSAYSLRLGLSLN